MGSVITDTLTYLRDVQPVLLGEDLSRTKLLRLPPSPPATEQIHVVVNRSMPFEYVAALARPVARTWGAELSWQYSDYDPAFAALAGGPRDLTLFWVDWRFAQPNLTPAAAARWFSGRAAAVRAVSEAPIAVNNWPDTMADEAFRGALSSARRWFRELNVRLTDELAEIAGGAVLDLAALAATPGAAFFDRRNDALSSYPLSGSASAVVGQHFGGAFSAALLRPRLKALVCDLDNTLYDGVLGEDGLDSLVITEAHRTLAAGLCALRDSGILLGLASKNDAGDVERLFAERGGELGLRLDDFTAVAVNWNDKPANLRSIAAGFNIDPSAMVFLDDNPAELSLMAERVPGVRLVHAADPAASWAQLQRLPGLYELRPDVLASQREQDIVARARREEAQAAAPDEVSYLAGLGMRIGFGVNRAADGPRLFEMSHKFNQFNLGLARMSAVRAEQALIDPAVTVTVRVADSFADSGLVGALSAEVDGPRATVREVLFSCRVLGRKIESFALLELLRRLGERGVTRVGFDVVEGAKNGPARDWLDSVLAGRSPDDMELSDLIAELSVVTANYPAEVEYLT